MSSANFRTPPARGLRVVRVLTAVLLLGGLLAARTVGGRSADPSFRRGGDFGAVGTAARPVPYTLSPEAQAGDSAAPLDDATVAAVPTADAGGVAKAGSRQPSAAAAAPATSAGRSPSGGSSGGSAAAPAASAQAAPAASPGVAAASSGATTRVRVPPTGTYIYAVDGTEGATGFGTRRYPPQMTVTVHGGDGLQPGEVAFDQRFSDQHEERLILAVGEAGLAATFEGGSITFGPGTQTSQAEYRPPMLLVPGDGASAPDGSTRRGASEAHDGDAVSRTEDWTVTLVRREPLTVLGRTVETWVVETHRQSRPGSSDEVTRDRTAWYAPELGTWVKWTERFDGGRSTFGVRFEYSTTYTATLAEVRPT